MLHEVSSDQARLLGMLFPHLEGLEFVQVEAEDAGVVLVARTVSGSAACRECGTPSARVHDQYRRKLRDLSCAGRPVRVELEVRRFRCVSAVCAVVTFAEQFEGVAQWRQRRTPGLRAVLERVALALAGRAGARLAVALGLPVARCTLLRLIRALPDPEVGQVTVLGVDEFAKRKGQSYATILVDMDTHQLVDVLDGWEAQMLADWLIAHPGVRVVCRDRAGGFAEGARLGAPDAQQCADWWHLYQNLCVAVDKTIRAHHAELREPAPVPSEHEQSGVMIAVKETPVVERTRYRHAEIHKLLAEGYNQTQICQILGLDFKTVQRYRRAATAEELLSSGMDKPRHFRGFMPYLRKRVLDDGCGNAAQLCRELREQGYRGSVRTIRRYIAPLRAGLHVPELPPKPPSIREVRRWITSDPEHLTDTDKQRLGQVTTRSPRLERLQRHVTAFAKMLIHRTGTHDLDRWLATIDADDLPHLHSFANGLRRDHAAVLNGLSLSYSSGAVEGRNCKIKHLKRIMYGRANHDLLRAMILHN